MEASERIEAAAAAFLARRDGEGWSEADEAELEAWLEASTAHRVAYLRLLAAWQQAARLEALGAGVPAGTCPSPGSLEPRTQLERRPPESMQGRGRYRIAAAAAAVVAVVAAGWHFGMAGKDTYRTPVGAVTTLSIPDGSMVTLNTDSEIRVAVTDTERRVELRQGEAYFEVARDLSRPFVVQAGMQRVVVLGTRFSVRRMDGDLKVVVTEGRVRVEAGGAAPDVAVAELEAGTVAHTAGGGTLIQREPLEAAETALSWRSGYLVFRETALDEAVAEFNRYNRRKLVIADPDLAAIRIGGNFRSTNVDAFVRLLEQGFRIRATRDRNEIVLTEA